MLLTTTNLLSLDSHFPCHPASLFSIFAVILLQQLHGHNYVEGSEGVSFEAWNVKADLVVAKDGSGDYRKIMEAVNALPNKTQGDTRVVIHVRTGVYSEQVAIKRKNVTLIGDGIDKTIITGHLSNVDGYKTYKTATVEVTGDGFMARGVTFENVAGPEKHQAVALVSSSNYSAFFQCSFKGYQDTLYVYKGYQFYRECDIYGTVDFIFGNAAAVLQKCNIYVRKPLDNQKNTITAQSREHPWNKTGISIHDCNIFPTPDLKKLNGSIKTFLGRPWRQYSRVVFMKCNLDNLIAPEGWLEWDGDFALDTLYYGEYANIRSDTSQRVKWKGFHLITNKSEAEKFTVGKFLDGGSWLQNVGVPYNPGL